MIGFTGTPIEKTDANTRAVFGGYISIYDIQRGLKHKNVATDLLAKLLKDGIKTRSKRNLVQSERFSEKLLEAVAGELTSKH